MPNTKFRILIVDDSITFAKAISEIIRNNIPDIELRAVNSGMEAIRVLGNNHIDLIIMDVFMPVYDGIEMAKFIRGNPRTSRIPIIFMTGADPELELRDKALEIGGIDYLNKNFKEEELVRLVNLYLRFLNWEREINEKLDEKIIELNDEISRRIVIEKSLLETTELLKEANSTKDKFFSIIAHDLKNPLGSFRNLTEIMLSDFQNMEDKDVIELLSVLKESSNNIYSLLENLLLWSRSQSGKIQFIPTNFNLLQLIRQVESIVGSLASDKRIKLTVKCPEDLQVVADMNMINTVIRNLFTNAIKFTSYSGHIQIIATKHNLKARIDVIDNGVGMSQDDIDNLFKIDKHKTKLGTNMETGTGLGLMICKDFLELHKTSLSVFSTEGAGSTFSFELPYEE